MASVHKWPDIKRSKGDPERRARVQKRITEQRGAGGIPDSKAFVFWARAAAHGASIVGLVRGKVELPMLLGALDLVRELVLKEGGAPLERAYREMTQRRRELAATGSEFELGVEGTIAPSVPTEGGERAD